MTATPFVLFGGLELPVNAFSVTAGQHGATGSALVTSSIKAVEDAGIDIVGMGLSDPTGLPFDVYVETDDGRVHLFGGEYLSSDWRYKADTVTLHARDHAGRLVDQKRVLTSGAGSGDQAPDESGSSSGVSTQNQRVSQLVTQIANQFELTPQISLPGDADVNIGAIFGDSTDTILTTIPQSLWGLLNRLAREVGAEVYVTPEKELVFAQQGSGGNFIFSWKMNPPPPGAYPALDLDITHNPRRNSTFRVAVQSYDPTLGKAVSGTNETRSSRAANTGGSAADVPIYSYHVDGLTAAQTRSKAKAIAKDISKREMVVRLVADVIPSLRVNAPAQLTGQIDPTFTGYQLYVNQFTHKYRVKPPEFDTALTLLTDNGNAGSASNA